MMQTQNVYSACNRPFGRSIGESPKLSTYFSSDESENNAEKLRLADIKAAGPEQARMSRPRAQTAPALPSREPTERIPLSTVAVGDILRLYGSEIGWLRPDHFCIVVADATYREVASLSVGIPLYAVTVMESVTGTKTVHWGCKLMCQEKDICYMVHGSKPEDRSKWVKCDILGCLTMADPEAFSNSLRETGCRRSRVSLGKDKWSYRTGLYAVTHSASLQDVKKMTTAENLERIITAWDSRPICTSTVIRSWQRYLVESTKSDEEAMEKIMAVMPLLSDRAMPAELLKTMKSSGVWFGINELAESRYENNRRWSGRALLLEALRLCD